MTNLQKFEQVFGFKPDGSPCVLFEQKSEVCEKTDLCEECTYGDWWRWEYRKGDNTEK